MSNEVKEQVIKLKNEGYGYKAISRKLNIPLGTVKSLLRRETTTQYRTCKQCGKEFKKPNGRKEKKFCSNKCRMKWWYEHQHLMNKKSAYQVECACCKKKFIFYGYKGRKYCSVQCYKRARYGQR